MILEPTSAILDMELNGLNLVTVEHDYDDLKRWESIKGDRVIKVDAPNDQTMLYKINDTDKSLDDSIEFTAIPLMQDLDKSALVDCRPTNSNGQQAIDKILEGTKFKGHSNISSIFTSHLIRKSRLAALIGDDKNSFISKYGGELFATGYDIWINDRIGSNKGVVFEYGKDIIDFNENLNWDNVLTRVYPVGFDGITLDNNGYIDSPNINKYQEIKEGFIKFDDVKVKETPEDEEGFNTLEEAQAELIKRTKELFENGLDAPTLEMDIEVEKLENTLDYKQFKNLLLVGLGDDVKVNLTHLGININTRVIAYTWDILNKKFISIKLGSYINNFIQDQVDISNVIDNITNSNGTVNAVAVQGILNGINVQMKAMRDIAQNVPVRAMICEDLIKDSPTYGAMCYGTMGFMIASERTPDNKDWNWRTFGTGKGFFADLIVAGTMLADRIRGGILESIDGSLKIDLTDTKSGIQFMKNGLKAISINGNQLDFFDWDGLGESIAKIYSTRFGSSELKTGLAIANKKGSAISLAYQIDDGTYKSYVTFDKDNILHIAAIQVNEDISFDKEASFNANVSIKNKVTLNIVELFGTKDGRVGLNKCDSLTISDEKNNSFCSIGDGNIYFAKNGKAYFYKDAEIERLNFDIDVLFNKNIHVNGNINCSGTINGKAVHTDTSETKKPIQTLFQKAKTLLETTWNEIKIDIPSKLKDRFSNDYFVRIEEKEGPGDIWIAKKTEDYFIVKSQNPIKFTYKIEATLKNCENDTVIK